MFKRNQEVVKITYSGDSKSASLEQVKGVRKGVVKLVDSDLLFNLDNGAQIDPVDGVSSEIIPLV